MINNKDTYVLFSFTLPLDALEPGMLLNLARAVCCTEAFLWVVPQKLLYEVLARL